MCDIRRAGCGAFQSPASAEEVKNKLGLKPICFFGFLGRHRCAFVFKKHTRKTNDLFSP